MSEDFSISRRNFLSAAGAFSVWPGVSFAAPQTQELGASAPFWPWEDRQGNATQTVFVRRVYLDLAGRIPTKDEVKSFLASQEPCRRELLVDKLLASSEFADYWSLRLCDILRVKSEFPINLWPNAVYVYHRRIRQFVEANEAWDHFGRALLTSQGSNFRDGEVNFFRATDMRTPEGWSAAVAETFLGLSPEALSPKLRASFLAAFANVKIKDTREWKEEIVFVEGSDRRGELCEHLFGVLGDEVARAFGLRVREWIFGPVEASKVAMQGLHLKDLLRRICLSEEYARGSVTGGFPIRRLDAEVLDDALCSLSGMTRDLQSPAPEPYTFLPPARRTVCVEDGSISTAFLSLFGRPARDTGLMSERNLDVTAKQRLYLFNSARLNQQLGRLVAPWKNGKPDPKSSVYKMPFPARVDDLYWKILSRGMTARERGIIVEPFEQQQRKGRKMRPYDLLRDVAWCLVNSKEFLFRV